MQFAVAQNKPKEIPPIIPYWAFGHWVWEDEKNTRDAVEILVNGYLTHNIPVSAVIIDSPWMNSYNDFEPDSICYPGFATMIDSLHHKGIRALAFYTGCINSTAVVSRVQKCKTFDYVLANNYAINENKQTTWFKGTGMHIDLTNLKARDWWHTQVDALYKLQLDGAKIDFGFAWFGDTVQTSIGRMSNREFGYQYYGDAFDYNVSRSDEFVSMTYAWSGMGLMGFPSKSHVNWVGDFSGDWKGIKKQLKNIYRSADYGFSGIGCEIGGYWGVPSNKEQFIRYAQLGCFCPVMINGGQLGSFAHHLPWNHGEEAVSIYRQFVALHYQLSWYLFSAAVDAHLKRNTILKNCSQEQGSHFLGDQLFVKVISDSLPKTSFRLPATSKWIDFWDNDSVYPSNFPIERTYPLNQYPVFVKTGAILPWNVSGIVNGDVRNNRKTTFFIFPDSLSCYLFHKPTGNGTKYTDILVSVDMNKRTIAVDSDTAGEFVFVVKWQKRPKQIQNADKWNYDSETKTVRIEKAGRKFAIKLII
jgi:alpha-glucosidase (family GH31 glycosyl hydrolase)